MTVLGALFIAAYAVSLIWGRRGILAVLSCAIPLNDSAALIVGEATLSPFYLGVGLYLTLSLLAAPSRRSNRSGANSGLLLAFLAVTATTAIFAPQFFAGTRVVAPGLGLDEQVGALTPLEFSLSSLAQVLYLLLNLGLVFFNERDRLLAQRHLALGLALGVAVGLWAYAGWRFGIPFAQELFDNNPRGQYIVNPNRLRAQFSEASHLGGFSLAAVAFYAVRTFQSRTIRQTILNAALAAGATLLLVSTASGTAAVGALVAAGSLFIIGAIALARGVNTVRIAPASLLAILVVLVAGAFAAGAVVDSIVELVNGKQGGVSLATRSYVDAYAVALTRDTWGFGVGLGNNRSSSMLLMLLSTIGVLGTALFGVILVRAIRNGLADLSRRASAITLVAFVAAAAVSLADFVSPVMWVAIAVSFPMARAPGRHSSYGTQDFRTERHRESRRRPVRSD